MKDHYQTLGLDRSASEKQIKQAYRGLCKQYHPDHNKSSDAHARMQEINEAHRVLSSPVGRAEYDQLLRLQEQQRRPTTDAASAPGTPEQCRCEKCGRVEPTLRVTVFTWVVSFIVVTYRHGWAKILCARCRTKYALLFDLQNFFMGWWGIPFGLLWTLKALWHNSLGGQQPEENNALFLAGLGYEFHRKGDLKAAASALKASLQFKKDPRVEAFYWQTQARFHENPAAYKCEPRLSLWQRLATGALHPALYCVPLLALLFGAGYLWIESDKNSAVRARSEAFSTQQESTQFQSGGISALDQKVLRKAEAGNARSQLEVARKLYGERNNDAEAAEGLEWYRKAARQGLCEAQFELADKLENEEESILWEATDATSLETDAKESAARDHAEAQGWYRSAAELGHAEAQYRLALELCGRSHYAHPFHPAAAPAHERAEALKWYRKAAHQGNVEAQADLAKLLNMAARGLVSVDGPTNWEDKLFEISDPAARETYGAIWLTEITNRVIDQALETESWMWCRKAAARTNSEAAVRLASHCEKERDFKEAARWWKVVADQGYPAAAVRLADMYDHGRGVPQDPAQATDLLLHAANRLSGRLDNYTFFLRENPEPLLKLGERFESGLGVRRDPVEAYKWFDLVAGGAAPDYGWDPFGSRAPAPVWQAAKDRRDSLGRQMTPAQVSEAQARASVYLASFLGKEEFIRQLKEANNGDAKAQLSIGWAYRRGDYGHRNSVEAIKWIQKAAEQGDADAECDLGEYHYYGPDKWGSGGTGVANPMLGAMYFHQAAEQGHPRAQFLLGLCYANGIGETQNAIQAYKWFRIVLAGEIYSGFRDNVESCLAQVAPQMTPQQIAYAERFAREFVPQGPRTTSPREQTGSASEQLKASGSGFFISDDGNLISNCHVVEGASRIMVKTKGGVFPARVVKLDPVNDIAVLKVSGSGFYALPITQSGSVKLGDSVFTIGFPNPGLQGVQPKLTDGKVNSLTGMLDDPRCFQVSIAVQPGNSGGALVSSAGNVVGIVTARLSDEAALQTSGALPQNVNYAIKSSYLLPLLEGVPELGGKLKQPSPAKERKFADVVKEAQEAAALVLVF